MQKPQPPKGMRDFTAEDVFKRQYIFNTISSIFETYGYGPLETPSMENLQTLTGKYGEEGDRLIFKVLKSGDFLKELKDEQPQDLNSQKVLPLISDKALRYDLTIPLARFLGQNAHKLTFPFRRYQIQPVWRADRPQKGRFREFTQCDGDIVGDNSLLCELELIQIYNKVFDQLGLKDKSIKLNNRKILAGIAQAINLEDQLIPMTIIIDKIDKIGKEDVKNELLNLGVTESNLKKIDPLFNTLSKDEMLTFLEELLKGSEVGNIGLLEIKELFNLLEDSHILKSIHFDPLLARGLDYYTGTIVEVIIPQIGLGSLGGGGRYDNLTEIFGLKDISGVGISFGIDRIAMALEMRELFPSNHNKKLSYMLINFGHENISVNIKLANLMRDQGVHTEIYPSEAKIKKQMKYANQKCIDYVLIQGKDEITKKKITLKKMSTGEQTTEDIDLFLKNLQTTKYSE